MTCYDPCSKEEEILERLATLEANQLTMVKTVNGVYGPFITLDFPDVNELIQLINGIETNSVYKHLDYNGTYIDDLNTIITNRNTRFAIISYEYYNSEEHYYDNITIDIPNANTTMVMSNLFCLITVITTTNNISIVFTVDDGYTLKINDFTVNENTEE